MNKSAAKTSRYRGYALSTGAGQTDIWSGWDWVDVKRGPDSLEQARRQVDEWLDAR